MKTLMLKILIVWMRVLNKVDLKLTSVPADECSRFRTWLIDVVQNWKVRVNLACEDLSEEIAQTPDPVAVPGHVHVANVVLVVLFLLLVAGTAAGGYYLFSEAREVRVDLSVVHHDKAAIDQTTKAFRAKVGL